MKGICRFALAAIAAMSLLRAAAAFDFQLVPIDAGGGYSLSGSISTDGTVGALHASNITSWSITVTSVTEWIYNRSNAANVSYGYTESGGHLTVATSPDGVQDGGSLSFRGGNHLAVQVADFSGTNVDGGQAYYVYGGTFGTQLLHQPNSTDYVAATERAGSPHLYDLTQVDFSDGVRMLGDITTDGAGHILDWNVVVRQTLTWNYTQANTAVLNDFNLSTDGESLFVQPFDPDGGPGRFTIGNHRLEPTVLVLADYTNDPQGQAGFIDPFNYQLSGPISTDSQGRHVVATAVPEPVTWVAFVVGLPFLARRRQRSVLRSR